MIDDKVKAKDFKDDKSQKGAEPEYEVE